MTRSGTFFAAVLVAVGRPAWWLMALATFLLRGGILIVILPIITLPSVLALSNLFGPILVPLALGRIELGIVIGPAVAVVGLLVWLIIGGRIAAGIDVAFVREAADAAVEEGVARAVDARQAHRSEAFLAWRVLAIRLIALLPLAVAVGLCTARIVEVSYLELTRPVDVTTPIVVRVAGEIVSQLGLIVVVWAIGEVICGAATRHVALTDAGHGQSLAWAIRTTASSPLSWLVPWLATTALLVVVAGAMLAAGAFLRTRTVDALSDRLGNPIEALLTLLLFVAVWLGAMVAGGAILAVRSTLQTFEHVRRSASAWPADALDATRPGEHGAGTFGGPTRSRPGDWSHGDDGGSL